MGFLIYSPPTSRQTSASGCNRIMTELDTLLASVEAVPPTLPVETIAAVVEAEFGLLGDYQPLVSERDQNFRLKASTGDQYVVKVTGLKEESDVSDCQISALLHLHDAGIDFVPRVIRTRDGQVAASIVGDDGEPHLLRLVSYLQGMPLAEVALNEEICKDFGLRLAQLDLAFQGFAHAGDQQVLIWDTQRAGALYRLLRHVDDDPLRMNLATHLQHFIDDVSPRLAALPRQVIHNDANAENILIDESGAVSGVIDFGDLLRAPRIVEVANAAAYLPSNDNDPTRFVSALLRGYEEVSPLRPNERDLLWDLIRTRLAVSLCILHWRLMARDAADPYRQKSLEGAVDSRRFLASLSELK